mgnify:CR=1 FL=1
MKSSDEKIKDYGLEFGVSNLTLDQLIDSHREIRLARLETQNEFLARVKEACERASKITLDSNWIKIEDLKKLTFEEFVNRYF